MRLIHTSDIHLDASYAAGGMPVGFGNRRRQSLRDVFHAIVARAGAWPADALLIAGDLFEADRVTPDTVAFLKAEFQAIRSIPVFIAPGNHDPYLPASPYALESWPDNVVIFDRPTWASHELAGFELTVHGFAFDGPDVSSNPFGHLQLAHDDRVHVAIAHGSEMSCLPPEKGSYAPFSAAAIASERLTYLALGHYHAMKRIEAPFGTHMYYSGAPEGHSFREPDVHCFLEIEIDHRGLHVTPAASCSSVYSLHLVDCSGFSSSQQVVDAIRALPRSDEFRQIARITLEGTSEEAWRGEIPAIYDAVASSFEFLDLVDELEPVEDYETLAREETSLGTFVRRMNEEIEAAVDTRARRMLQRARETGVAAYRGRQLAVRGMDRE